MDGSLRIMRVIWICSLLAQMLAGVRLLLPDMPIPRNSGTNAGRGVNSCRHHFVLCFYVYGY